MQKTKYYNKELYEIEKEIKTALIILIIFILGLFTGLLVNNLELQNKEKEIREYQVEIDSLKECIHLLEKEV
nr:MAG TPA: Lipopolysaccharide assembly protein A domain [Caudoviricetes sp.]